MAERDATNRGFPNPGARRLSAAPTRLGAEPGGSLLGDILDANLGERAERDAVRDWVRRAIRSAKLRDLADTRRDARRRAVLGQGPRAGIGYSARKHTRKSSHGAIHLDD